LGQLACLADALVAFIEGGVSLVVASVDAGGRPTVGRALGAQVSVDGRLVTLFLDRAPNRELLASIEATGRVAVTVTEPSTHRSVQLKGSGAAVGAAGAEVRTAIARHIAAFARDLERIGHEETFTRTLMAHDPATVVQVAFVPAEAYSQTPGPDAGKALASEAGGPPVP
jgi:hypothetical protein